MDILFEMLCIIGYWSTNDSWTEARRSCIKPSCDEGAGKACNRQSDLSSRVCREVIGQPKWKTNFPVLMEPLVGSWEGKREHLASI